MSTIYRSNFANFILAMFNYRESLGYSWSTYSNELKDFDRFCAEKYPSEHELTKQLALEWGAKRPDEKINNHNVRLIALRQFGKYLNQQGIEAYIIPSCFLEKQERYEPYLFTDEELTIFFRTIDTISESQDAPFSEYTLPVYFRIAYGCGLRPNELYNLRRYDINFKEQTIFVYNSKTKRDRLITLTLELSDLCQKYDRIADKQYPNRKWFFYVDPKCLNPGDWFQHRLSKYWISAGLQKRFGKCPRVYDFRHNYATRILLRWFDEGKDIMVLLPFLSSYMGHVVLSSTLYYVHLLPERLRNNKAFEWSKFESLLPEVDNEEK